MSAPPAPCVAAGANIPHHEQCPREYRAIIAPEPERPNIYAKARTALRQCHRATVPARACPWGFRLRPGGFALPSVGFCLLYFLSNSLLTLYIIYIFALGSRRNMLLNTLLLWLLFVMSLCVARQSASVV